MSDAETTLLAAWEERREGSFVTISLAGDGHCAAIVNAVNGHYNRISGRPKPTYEDLYDLIGEKSTLLVGGQNQFGASMIKAREGTIFAAAGGQLGHLPKRKRTNGIRVNVDSVLDVFPGYATEQAARHVSEVRAHFPQLTKITQERLDAMPAQSETLSLCIFGTYRLPDSTATDALILMAEYDKENDIIDTGVLLIRPECGISEHGSQYGRNILNGAFGEVVGYEPISFREGIELCNVDFDEAYARVIPHAPTLAAA